MCPYNAKLAHEARSRGPKQSDRSHDFGNYGLTAEQLAERERAERIRRYADRLSEEAWENEGGGHA